MADDYYTAAVHGAYEEFDLGSFRLASGYTLADGRLAYQTYGSLDDDKGNAILLPHMYSGTHGFMSSYIGEGRPLDPSKYFLIAPAQLGSGFGSSPSTTPPPYDRGAFPPVAIADDVQAQHRLVTEHFGIERLRLVSGWSMGGQQTYEWAVRHPQMVERAMPLAACLRTPDHNRVFIDMYTELLRSDPAFRDGFYDDPSDVALGLRRHAMAFALMGATAAMYREETWRELEFASADDFIQGFSQGYFLPMDPNNLLCQAAKWRAADVGWASPSLEDALAVITARMLVVAFKGDLVFPPEDIESDARRIPGALFREIGTVWGHLTMFNLREEDTAAIDALYAEILAE